MSDTQSGERRTGGSPIDDVARLDALRRTGVLDTPPEASFDRLTALAARLLGVPVALVSLVDAERQFFKSCLGLPEPWNTLRQTPLTHSFCQHAVISGEPLVIEDAREHPLVKDNLAVGEVGIVAYAGIPLKTSSGQVLGSFCVVDTRPRRWSDEDLDTLRTLAAAASTELELRDCVADQRAQRERAEHERSLSRQAERALRETNTVLRAVVDGSSDAIFVKDAAGRYVMINRAGAEIVGMTVEQIIGRDDSAIFEPETARRVMEADHRVMESGASQTTEHSYSPRGGGELTLQTFKGPYRDDAGNVVGVIGIGRDVTRRKRAEDELLAAKEQAESANRAKDRFLAVLSHELRSPLAPVLALASAWEQDPAVPASLREDLSMIRRNVELEVRLIDDMLDMTRIAKGKLRLAAEPVDAHTLLRHAVRTCPAEELERRRLTLETDLRATRAVVTADAARFQQILWNLLNNAVKFTPDGGRITVRTWDAPEGRLAVEVADTGIGIEPAVLPKIFDAFEQGAEDVTDKFGGLGLGLAICKALARGMGGEITAASGGAGKGASFKVVLPTCVAPVRAAPVDAGIPGGASASGPVSRGRPLRILLVEDNVDTSCAMSKLLSRIGHHVRTAGTLRAAVDAARSGPVDVVISDLGLPDGSGHDLMRLLRPLGPIRGIALSGYGTDEDVRKSHAAGFDTHLTKPTDFERLVKTIDQLSTSAAVES